MKTITVTEAKRSLGQYLKMAAGGEEIGIISGADIISLRKVQVVPVETETTARIMETPPASDWPTFPTFDGGPVDGALNHDKYLYDEPKTPRTKKRRP